ncbi:bifunctional phosphopantothenoylcysteine decarboxylase/phosphopantothenate--cysteine ligase CoaBC [bacterium]|nr:bifunctional phosphopantothenoylcysteine decarboxylase/phosphopantothenate--cysteine ligase CoaBC [bacterium]
MRRDLQSRRILVAVTGGIAAYKTVDLVRRLLKRGASVRVMMTDSATRFVHPTTFAAISGQRVSTSMWSDSGEPRVDHLELPHWAELIVVAPSTANMLAKLRHGIADDLVSTALLAATCPILVAPAMNPTMWDNIVTRENMQALLQRGIKCNGPNSGEMAAPGEKSGEGRMSEPDEIEAWIVDHFHNSKPLAGKVVLITAGRTEEPIDKVRVLTNRSSGRMGAAIAEEALHLGAEVIFVHGGMDVEPPLGACQYYAPTTLQMLDVVQQHAGNADVAFYVAAVSDWRPAQTFDGKFKRTEQDGDTFSIELVENPDIAATTAKSVKGLAIGFALEVSDALDYAREKLQRKNLDAILFNRETNIGAHEGALTWVTADESIELGSGGKRELAERVLRQVLERMKLD